MQLHVLDEQYRRKTLIDKFESMIWAERFSTFGDFELVILSNVKNRAQFAPGAILGIDESQRVMLVETVESTQDNEGRQLLSVKGRSLELILEERVLSAYFGSSFSGWGTSGTPIAVATSMFDFVVRDLNISIDDGIPFLTAGPSPMFDTVGDIPAPIDNIVISFDGPVSLYSAIKDLCDRYALGFRLVSETDESKLYFEIYTGKDRRSSQSILPPVVFSPALDNLTNVSALDSIAAYKNTAYVYSVNGKALVIGGESGLSQTGFTRRVLIVDASDITDEAGPTLDARLQARGLEELAKAKRLRAFDGAISQFSMYTYNDDYLLGDLVEMRTEDGVIKYVRVVEQIFVSDAEGDRSYPTLSDVLFITPGSWLDWKYNVYWEDLVGTWLDLEDDQ